MGEFAIDALSETNAVPNNDDNVLHALSAELHGIMAHTDWTLQKNNELTEKISLYESRVGYVHAANLEGEKIAQGINNMAQARVQQITEKAHAVVGPLHANLAVVEKEIAVLTKEMNPPEPAAYELAESIPAVEEVRREFSLGAPQQPPVNVVAVDLDTKSTVSVGTKAASLGKREYSLRLPEEPDLGNDNPSVPQAETQSSSPQWEEKREYSLRYPPEQELAEENTEGEQIEQVESDSPLVAREYSLREPQDVTLIEENPESEMLEQSEPEPAPVKREYSLRDPQEPDSPPEKLEIVDPTADESAMRLDVFIDAQHRELIEGEIGPIHKHSWQVKIEVEIPVSSRIYTSYGKVFSAVTCTLMRYDAVLLNEVFPFTLIEPSMENAAMYFYNCLEDTLAMMDLVLTEITLWENPNLKQLISSRNLEMDGLLNHGEDILEDMRGKLNVQNTPIAEHGFKTRLGRVFSL